MRPNELDLTYTLDTLECITTEDDDSGGLFGGNGDEPYLWAVGFKVDGTTLGPPPPGTTVPSLNVQIFQGAPFFKHVVGGPHSVVTAHLIDAAGEPTLAARDQILSYLTRRLRR